MVISRRTKGLMRAVRDRSNSIGQSPSFRALKKRKLSETTAVATGTKTIGRAPPTKTVASTSTKRAGHATTAVPRQSAKVASASQVSRSLL